MISKKESLSERLAGYYHDRMMRLKQENKHAFSLKYGRKNQE